MPVNWINFLHISKGSHNTYLPLSSGPILPSSNRFRTSELLMSHFPYFVAFCSKRHEWELDSNIKMIAAKRHPSGNTLNKILYNLFILFNNNI